MTQRGLSSVLNYEPRSGRQSSSKWSAEEEGVEEDHNNSLIVQHCNCVLFMTGQRYIKPILALCTFSSSSSTKPNTVCKRVRKVEAVPIKIMQFRAKTTYKHGYLAKRTSSKEIICLALSFCDNLLIHLL